MGQSSLILILLSTFFQNVACLCVWQATLGSILDGTESGGESWMGIQYGIYQTNYGYPTQCNTSATCEQQCDAYGDKNCNHFVLNRQTGQAYFFYIEPTASRIYGQGEDINGNPIDSYDRLCGAAVSLSPKTLQFIRDKCRYEDACQPSAQQLANAVAQRKSLEELFNYETPTIIKTFDKVRDAKRAFWAWIGFPNMTVLDTGLFNGDEILNYEQAEDMVNFYKNISSQQQQQPVIDYQMPWGRPIDSSDSGQQRQIIENNTNPTNDMQQYTTVTPLTSAWNNNYSNLYTYTNYSRQSNYWPRKKRGLFVDFLNNNRGQKWLSKTIKYKFDYSTGIQSTQVQAVQTALNWLQSPKTCLDFVQDQTITQDGIVFKRGARGVGCAGHVGKQSGGLNHVIFDDSCATPGHLVHEIMHNLGVRHEHQRPDRDSYISLVLENLDPTMLDESQILANQNFETDSQTVDFNTKYDYSSVMHYPNRAAAKASLPFGLYTILTFDASAQTKIGQRTSVSGGDTLAINRAYGCITGCVYSAWSSYGLCVNGQKTRIRTILKPSAYGGKPCSKQDLTDTAVC